MRIPTLFLLFACFCPVSAQQLSVYFDTDKHLLRADAISALQTFCDTLTHKDAIHIRIKGNTDFVGNEQYNVDLSGRRCASVRAFLTGCGLADFRISSEPLGEGKPLTTDKSEKGRQLNRRVDIFLEYIAPPKPEAAVAQPPLEGEETAALAPATPNKSYEAQDFAAFMTSLSDVRPQSYTLNPNTDTVLTLESGTQLFVFRHSFEGNEPVVVVSITEYIDPVDMWLRGLYTLSGDLPLQTGGMFYIEAQNQDGQAVNLVKGRGFLMKIPIIGEPLPGMRQFRGHLGADSATVDWVEVSSPGRIGGGKTFGNCDYVPLSKDKNLKASLQDYCKTCPIYGLEGDPRRSYTLLARVLKRRKYKDELGQYRLAKRELSQKMVVARQMFQQYKVTDCKEWGINLETELLKSPDFLVWKQNMELLATYRDDMRVKADARSYWLDQVGLGWVNCDRYANQSKSMPMVRLKLPKLEGKSEVGVISTTERLILPAGASLPLLLPIKLVAVQEKEGQLYLDVVQLLANGEPIHLNMQPVTEEQLIERLRKQ